LPASREYVKNILVPTSVHIPPRLLESLDRHARRLGVSRNRVIIRALERELADRSEWSPGFFEALSEVDDGDREAVDELLSAVRARRTTKKPPKL
jgi:predicted transcriptional regulator